MQRLRIDAVTAEVMQGLTDSGVPALVLKGPSLVQWLYPQAERRTYGDTDILIRSGSEDAARRVLREHGFEHRWDENPMPDWWQEHASEWFRAEDGVLVDLHRRLVGVGADDGTAWAILSADTDELVVGGRPVPALSLPGRAFHIALHVAQHGAKVGIGIEDLRRALEVADYSVWQEAAALAARLEATDAFAAGLRLAPDGARMADRLGLPETASVEVALRAATVPPVALGFEQLSRAHGLRARAGIIWRKLFPPREFIVHWHPAAADSRRALALAYIRRPFWILRGAPRGFRAWRQARRKVRRGSETKG